jgi:YVTN family beta-propeller protein
MKKLVFLLVCNTIAAFSLHAQTKSNLQVLKTFHIGGTGGWDYLAVGPINDWLYLSHSNQVNIINKNTGDSVGVIEKTNGVHGIAFDLSTNKGFISNGKANTVFVFDLHTNKVIQEIKTGKDPDAIMYEPYSKKIITCNGHSNNLSIIDPSLNKVVDSVFVGGVPETAVSDNEGKLYVNIEDKNEIVVIDTKNFKVLNHWSIAPGDGPSGLAYDPQSKTLFAGCEKMMMVVNATNGKTISKLPIGAGCDGVAFDESERKVYSSNGDGTLTVIQQDNNGLFKVTENISTKRGARTISIDPVSHWIYLPTADLEPLPAGQKGRPKIIPGSFQVLVLGKK